LALDEPKGSDKSFKDNGISYIIDEDLLARTGDIVIDYIEMGWQSGFSITSTKPVGKASCSVGGDCCG
jgi:Fe-S cluster assembly iron-binding protein IscA